MKKLLFRGPVTTASGYGVHARQVLGAVIRSGLFDVSVQAIRWGETSFIFPNEDPFVTEIYELVKKHERERRLDTRYDVSIQVTIPNEFQKLAPINIGVTAGIEVDRVSPHWIVKANEMVDLVIVPSIHSAETFANVQYQDEKGNIIRLEKPLAVVPESVDVRHYNTDPVEPVDFLDVDTDFNFLTVGLGLDKQIGEDRKNITSLVKWFCERFKDDRKVGLVLKVGLVGNSLLDHDVCRRRIGELKRLSGCGEFPRIYLVHGRLSDEQMAALYKHPSIKAYITLTHGEGYGLPIIEAAACGLPVMAPAWSGHVDFLTIDGKKKFVPLEHEMKTIPDSAVWDGVMERGTNWACVKEDDTKAKMKKIVLSYDRPKEWALELAGHISKNYSQERIDNLYSELFGRFLTGFVGVQDKQDLTPEQAVVTIRERLELKPGERSLLYTMPMSAGDVYISTAVVDSLRKKYPDHRILFATGQQYSEILRDNPDVDMVIGYEGWMQDVPFCERIFDEVYTPNLAIQTVHANWVRGGKGRRLAEEIAAQCQVELGAYKIALEDPGLQLPEKFIAFHPGSGQGQWEARNYNHWQEVVSNLVALSGLPVVQVGLSDDPLYAGVTDLRGRTPMYRNLAYVVSKATVLVGIDSVTMHMAAGLGTPHVAIFGSSYANSTGPTNSRALSILIDTPNRYTCEKACYKHQCTVDRGNPCINEISPRQVVESALQGLGLDFGRLISGYEEYRPKISGYTHVLNADSHGYPYVESIRSMLGFCDEVVVVDGGSTDDTLKRIEEIGDERIKVYTREWDWNEPGMDGMQKAYGRAMCTGDFLWQQDADEVVHEDDYEKVLKLVKRFPRNVDLVHLPVVELWGDSKTVRTDRHSWKWRISRNNFRITHGINRDARVLDEKTGRQYAKRGMSDGCEFIDIMTGEFISHGGFYSRELENIRQTNPKAYGDRMNNLFDELPCVFHYSWVGLERKVRHFKQFWNKCWSNLYNDPQPVDRFAGVDTDEQIAAKAAELREQGGEYGQAQTFVLGRSNPKLMDGWLENVR